MSKTAIIAIVVIVIALGGFGAYSYAVRPTKVPTQTSEQTKPVATNTQTGTTGTETDTTVVADGAFHFDNSQTSASFSLGETLRGKPVTVVGTTGSVTGTFTADRNALASAKLGDIRINARTFVTDSEQRNNAIRRFILKTEDDANEFIVFSPTEIKGLPASANLGQAITFEILGNLTIAGVTKPVTFKGTMAFASDNQLSGKAQTTLHYPDFGVTVPDLPFLADVEKDILLKIDFLGNKQ